MSQLAYQIAENMGQSASCDFSTSRAEDYAESKASRILVVDDDPLPRELISSFLETQEFEAVAADSGMNAVAQLADSPFDLVLTDMSMPGMSGMEVLQWVREHQPTLPVILVTGMCELKTAVRSMQLGAFDYVTKPFELEVVLDRVQQALKQRSQLLEEEKDHWNLSISLHDRSKALDATLENLVDEHNATLEALIRALDARAHETESHSVRVRAYALCLADWLELDEINLEDLAQGALLHDVGMIGVSDTILLKTGKLTESEWKEVRKHPLIGPEIVGNLEPLGGAIDVIRSHHERLDGRGYPDALSGTQIPTIARIVSVVDTYDAIVSDRPYRSAQSPRVARWKMAQCAGSQLDPDMVETFLRIPQSELDNVAQSARFQGGH